MVSGISKKILAQLEENLAKVSDEQSEKFIEELSKSKNVLVAGAGRSGLVAKAFGMRLMHLGLNVNVVGDTVTPPIKKDDLIIVISGSGETSSVKIAVETAVKHGARMMAITGNAKSSIGRLADVTVQIPTMVPKTKGMDYVAKQLEGVTATLTPLGTVFELSAHVFCDSIVAEMMDRMGVSEEQMEAKHTNIE